MATATLMYYCHSCNERISPITDDIICPNCQGGFVEQLDSGEENLGVSMEDLTQDGSDEDMFSFQRLFTGNNTSQLFPNVYSLDLRRNRDNLTNGSAASTSAPYNLRHRNNRPESSGGSSNQPQRADQDLFLQDMMQRILGGFDPSMFQISVNGGGIPFMANMELHGNTGDYAWGPNGLDNVISQLLGQLENAGPPPASKEAIDNLPTITVQNEDVEVERDCSVCMDAFKLNEKAKKLPCEHFFHIPCIEPWLKLHNTCPICRKLVENDPSCGPQTSSSSADSSNSASASTSLPQVEHSLFSIFQNFNRSRGNDDDDDHTYAS